MITLDTSALIRFLVNDDVIKAKKVEDLLISKNDLFIPDVVVLEINFILLKKYLSSKQLICERVENILSLVNVNSSVEIKKALKLYETYNISMADCLIIAGLKSGYELASFDKKLLKIAKVKSVF